MSDDRRRAFAYLFTVYLLCSLSETLVSPLFPLLRGDLDLVAAQQATLLAVVAGGIAVFNVVGGAIASRHSDRGLVRVATALHGVGLVISGLAGSYAVLLVGQAVVGAAFGLFYPSGLASVARLYAETRGRAIANYGLAYSLGLAGAALSANVGEEGWRAVFLVTGVASFLLAPVAPRWIDAAPDSGTHSLLSQLRSYAGQPDYRYSAVTMFAGLVTYYVLIGFAPVLYVDRGVSLALVTGLIAIGRFASVPGKIVGGALFDRYGGLWTVRLLMGATVLLAVPMVALPGGTGVWFVAPFVAVSSSVFPVANALLVAALPPRSAWGIGTFRSVMLGGSALLSAVVGLLLTELSLPTVMLGSLVVPLAAGAAAHAGVRAGELATPSRSGGRRP